MREANHARVQELFAEMDALREAGKLTRAEWVRITREAATHMNDQGWKLEQFMNFQPEEDSDG